LLKKSQLCLIQGNQRKYSAASGTRLAVFVHHSKVNAEDGMRVDKNTACDIFLVHGIYLFLKKNFALIEKLSHQNIHSTVFKAIFIV